MLFPEGHQLKLLSDDELASINWMVQNLAERRFGKTQYEFLHYFILNLIERRIQNEQDPVAVFMGRSISGINTTSADSQDILSNFISFARVYTRMSRGLQRNKNGVLKGIMDRRTRSRGLLGTAEYKELKGKATEILNPKLESIEFRDGGNAIANYPEFLNGILENIAFPIPERPEGIPQQENGAIQSSDLSPEMLDALSRVADASLWYGRTLVVPMGKKAVHIKFLKQGEQAPVLKYEFDMMNYLNKRKTEWGLRGEYPRGLAALVRVNVQSHPEIPSIFATQKGPLVLAQDNGDYLAMVYETDLDSKGRNPYTTYLNDPDLTYEEFEKGFQININDIMKLAAHGIFNLELIELFHNQEHGNSRQYDWMVDVKHFQQTRRGAGRINDIPGATLYPNMRLSGLSDFAGFRSIKDLLEDQQVRNRADNRFGRLLNMVDRDNNRAAPYIISSVVGDALLSLSFIPVTYLQNRDFAFHDGVPTELSYESALDQNSFLDRMIKMLFIESGIDYSRDPDVLAISPDYNLIAQEYAFFMNGDYVTKPIPSDFYTGATVTQLVRGRGWSLRGWNIRNTEYEIPSRNRELHVKVPSRDLGPVNGPNPVQELVRGLYIAIPQMVIGRLTSSANAAMTVGRPEAKKDAAMLTEIENIINEFSFNEDFNGKIGRVEYLFNHLVEQLKETEPDLRLNIDQLIDDERKQRDKKQGGFKNRVLLLDENGKPIKLVRDGAEKNPNLKTRRANGPEYRDFLAPKLKEEFGYLKNAYAVTPVDKGRLIHELAALKDVIDTIKDQAMTGLDVSQDFYDRDDTNFLRAVEYFNQNMVGKRVAWDDIITLYEIFRGDDLNPEYTPEEREKRFQTIEKSEFTPFEKLLEMINKKCSSRLEALKYAAFVWGIIIGNPSSKQIFTTPRINDMTYGLPGFDRVIDSAVLERVRQTRPLTIFDYHLLHPAQGHRRLAWFMMNYVLVNNGLTPVYFSREEREDAGGYFSAVNFPEGIFRILEERAKAVGATGTGGSKAMVGTYSVDGNALQAILSNLQFEDPHRDYEKDFDAMRDQLSPPINAVLDDMFVRSKRFYSAYKMNASAPEPQPSDHKNFRIYNLYKNHPLPILIGITLQLLDELYKKTISPEEAVELLNKLSEAIKRYNNSSNASYREIVPSLDLPWLINLALSSEFENNIFFINLTSALKRLPLNLRVQTIALNLKLQGLHLMISYDFEDVQCLNTILGQAFLI